MKKKQGEIEKEKAKEACSQYTKCTKRQIKDDYEDSRTHWIASKLRKHITEVVTSPHCIRSAASEGKKNTFSF